MAFISSPVLRIRSAAQTPVSHISKTVVYCCESRRVRVSRRGALRLFAASTGAVFIAGSSGFNQQIAMSADGVEKQDISVGNGASPQKGQKLFMHYTLTLGGFQDAGGKVVDSSRSRNSLFS